MKTETDFIVVGSGIAGLRAALEIAQAVGVLVREGRRYMRELIAWGAEFDRAQGRLLFTQEAAHSRRRILHARGDATGSEIVRELVARAGDEPLIELVPHAGVEELIVIDGRCAGVRYLDPRVRAALTLRVRAVVLAS